MLKVKRLTDTAKLPTRATELSAGYDIYADHLFSVSEMCPASISTGIAVKIPEGYVGLIQPRSGLAFKESIDTKAGVIDSDYTGEIKVLLTRFELDVYYGEPGDRIAQLVIIPCFTGDVEEVESLDETVRGNNGFGSSGK